MFEKEAEEYLKAQCQKRKEEYVIRMPEVYIADIPQAFKEGAEFGYNKANEWHYVEDGNLPKETDVYLVYRISGYGSKSIELIQYNSSRHFWCVDCQNEVIAWKEIVLPKEIE